MVADHQIRENPSSAGTTQASAGSAVGAVGSTFSTRNPGGPPEKNPSATKVGAKPIRGTAAVSAVNGEKTSGAGGLADGPKSQTTRVAKSKKEEKDKKDKGESAENQAPWWPAFSFDGRNAMKSKLVLNLRNCQYDLFKTIAIEELGWSVIDNRCNVLEPLPPSEVAAKSLPAASGEDEDEASTGDNSSAKNQAEPKSKERRKLEGLQCRLVKEHDLMNWDIFWADSGMTPEFLSSLSTTQRVNHFLGMYNICRKSTLGMHLKRFQKEFPEHYDFFPQTWMYPAEFHDILEYHKKKTEKRKEKVEEGKMTEAQSELDPIALYICKPESGSQGRGIFIAQKVEDMRVQLNKTYEKNRENMNEYLKVEQGLDTLQVYLNPNNPAERERLLARQMEKPQNLYIVQKYIKRPALYQGHKYDFRIYVLITSVISPMTIFLFNDGLVRLASEKYDYSKSYDDPFVHLTNYSLNKNNTEFDSDKHKLRLKDVLRGELVSTSQTGKTYRKAAKEIWHEIEQIVVKTVFVVQPQLQHLYRTSQAKEPDLCCDLLGFDVMLDHKLKPWMLEVNHMPSFRADTDIDYDIKHDLILNTLQILQLSVEQRRQQDVILKQEQKQAMQYGNVKRMTVKEHSERVRFDHNLIDQYIPGNNFKRIYPLDPGCGGVAPNGDELEELYVKLEKSAQTVWKKQVGMIQKSAANPNVHENVKKKKRRKNNKGLLTSMTSHVKDPKQPQYDEQEEGPEDGVDPDDEGLAEIEEQADGNTLGSPGKPRRDSAMSVGTEGGAEKRDQPGGGDLRHIVSNSNYRRGNLANNRQQFHQNQSQSSLSKNSNLRSTNNANAQRGMANANRASAFNTFVPPTNPNLHYGNQNRLMNQLKKSEQLASKSIQEELKNLPAHHPVPTLNEILTQLHQDPGFRQRYKEYCRAVLDGRFSFGGIKNPIYDHIYGGNPAIQPTAAAGGHVSAYNLSYQNSHKPGVFYDHSYFQNGQKPPAAAGFPGPPAGPGTATNQGGVTLLSTNPMRNQQLKQGSAPYYQHQTSQSVAAATQSKRGKLETIPHQQVGPGVPTAPMPPASTQNPAGLTGSTSKVFQNPSGPTISEAAYFIQRVNKILQNQGSEGQTGASSVGMSQSSSAFHQYGQQPPPPGFAFNFSNAPPAHQPQGVASQMNQYNSSQGAASSQNLAGGNPYIGLAIQSVNSAQNANNAGHLVQILQDSQSQGLQVQHQHAPTGQSYSHTLRQLQTQQSGGVPGTTHSGSGNHRNTQHSGHQSNAPDPLNQKLLYKNSQKISQSQSAQKSINKIQSLQNHGSAIAPLSSSPQKAPQNTQNQQENPTLQKTVIDLIKNTVTQHPGQKLNSIQMKKQNGQSNQAQIPLTLQQQQILQNLSSSQSKHQRLSQRLGHSEPNQVEQPGIISSNQIFTKKQQQAQNYNNANFVQQKNYNEPQHLVRQISHESHQKQQVKTPVQQQHSKKLEYDKIKIIQSSGKASSSLSSHMMSKTPPFNGHKQQEFENMKRQLQVSKGIGGISNNEPPRENLGSYASNNGFSPSLPQKNKGALGQMNGTGGLQNQNHGIIQNGPIKAMKMSMNNMDRVLNSQNQVENKKQSQKQNMNNSLNNFIQVNGEGQNNHQQNRMNNLTKGGNHLFVRDIESKGSEKRASNYQNLNKNNMK